MIVSRAKGGIHYNSEECYLNLSVPFVAHALLLELAFQMPHHTVVVLRGLSRRTWKNGMRATEQGGVYEEHH